MRPNPTRAPTGGLAGYVSEHRFRLAVLASALALVAMLAAVYSNVGFAPIWAAHTVPAPTGPAPR